MNKPSAEHILKSLKTSDDNKSVQLIGEQECQEGWQLVFAPISSISREQVDEFHTSNWTLNTLPAGARSLSVIVRRPFISRYSRRQLVEISLLVVTTICLLFSIGRMTRTSGASQTLLPYVQLLSPPLHRVENTEETNQVGVRERDGTRTHIQSHQTQKQLTPSQVTARVPDQTQTELQAESHQPQTDNRKDESGIWTRLIPQGLGPV